MTLRAITVSVPLGMDAALEGLARGVLKEQPADIYLFGASYFDELIRNRELIAHNAKLSPSSTEETNSKHIPIEDGIQPVQEEKSITEEPESNDTSHGVEATAVRTLAASTGTVAILGTTAKTGDKKEAEKEDCINETLQEEQVAQIVNKSDNLIIEKHLSENISTESKSELEKGLLNCQAKNPSSNDLPDESLEINADDKVTTPTLSTNNVVIDNPPSKSECESNVKSVPETTPDAGPTVSIIEGNTIKNSSAILTELGEKEDDTSKSISSEQIKTDSISNTTLSSDSIADLDSNCVKQSPSVDKVVESFDSSCTVEFVDIITKCEPEGTNSKIVPSDEDETCSPINISGELTTCKDEKNSCLAALSNLETVSDQNSGIANPTSNEVQTLLDDKMDSNLEISNQSVIVESNGKSTDNEVSDLCQNDTCLSQNHEDSDNSTAVETTGDTITEFKEDISDDKLNTESIHVETKGLTTNDKDTECDIVEGQNAISNSEAPLLLEDPITEHSEVDIAVKGSEESKLDPLDDKIISAATTIQSSFRGFQTRKELKAKMAKEGMSENHSCDMIYYDKDPDLMNSAANKIQANFRGFYTRKMMKHEVNPTFYESNNNNKIYELQPSSTLPPTTISSIKKEVDEMCKEAAIIVAERIGSNTYMVSGVEQVVLEAKEHSLPTESESIEKTPTSNEGIADNEANIVKEDEIKFETKADETAINDVTTVLSDAQYMDTLEKSDEQFDSMPDYPPPAAEDEYLQSLEDLPPPDFEALESSFSEDVPTEPLAPPPPIDQDSMVLTEDDIAALEKPQECDEMVERAHVLETDSSDSSMSSAATKIQAGVRGYLARKQMQVNDRTGTVTTATSDSTNMLDSDQSLSVSVSREDEGVRSAISTEEETEIFRHKDSVSPKDSPKASRSVAKRMSLTNSVIEQNRERHKAPLRTAMSVQNATDKEIWGLLKDEVSDAATTIQARFRGYRTRKQLQREDAVQVTSSSSPATPSSGSVEVSGAAEMNNVKAATHVKESDDGPPTTKTPIKSLGSLEASDVLDVEKLNNSTIHNNEAEKLESLMNKTSVPTANNQTVENVTARNSGEYHDSIALHLPDLGNNDGDGTAHVSNTTADDESKTARDIGMEQAATKIQAGFRGHKVRKPLKNQNHGESTEVNEENEHNASELAATKIQAGVRGFLVRQHYRKERDSTKNTRTAGAGNIDGE